MKMTALALIISLGSIVNAKPINFECSSSDLTYMNKFTASGTLEVDGVIAESAYSNTEINWNLSLQERGFVSDIEIFEDVISYGETKKITTMTIKPFLYTVLKLEAGEKDYDVRLLFGYSKTFDSKIRDIETNKTYRANCNITE